jgi:hypothetical protein
MRSVISIPLFAGAICFSDAGRAQVNYDLIAKAPTPSSSKRTTSTEYSAIVLSYRDNKIYICTGEWGDLNDALGDRWLHVGCLPSSNFEGSLLSDRNTVMKLVLVPAPLESQGTRIGSGRWEDYFWQIDQVIGQVQLCNNGASGGSCVRWEIQPISAAPDAPAAAPNAPAKPAGRRRRR